MEEFCSGRKAGGRGFASRTTLQWPATMGQLRGCWEEKKMNLTVRREPAGSSGSPGPIPIQSLSSPIRRTKSEP